MCCQGKDCYLLSYIKKKKSITPLSVISLDSRSWAWEAKSFPRKHNWLVLAFIIRCVINGSSSTDLRFFSCFPPKIRSCACWKKCWGRFCLYICHSLQFTYFLQAAPKLYTDRSVSWTSSDSGKANNVIREPPN